MRNRFVIAVTFISGPIGRSQKFSGGGSRVPSTRLVDLEARRRE